MEPSLSSIGCHTTRHRGTSMLGQVWSCRVCCQWTDNWSPSQCWSVCFAGPPGNPRDGAQKLDFCIENGRSQSSQVTLDFSPSPTSAFSSHKPIGICLKIEDPQFKWVINVSHCLKINQMAKHMINGSLVGQVTHKRPTSVPYPMAHSPVSRSDEQLRCCSWRSMFCGSLEQISIQYHVCNTLAQT